MKTVIIVSKCLRVTNFNATESSYEFHLKGVCAGERLRRVTLYGRHDFNIVKDEEYLLYVNLITFEAGVLRGRIIKLKVLSECWDRS